MANQELTELLNLSMPFAIETLCRHGEFQPFGLCVHNNSEIEPYHALIGHMRRPRRHEIDRLYRHIKSLAMAREIKACCVCRAMPFRNADENALGCAIHCSLEHIDGDALDVFLPFTYASDLSTFTFGALVQEGRQSSFFENHRGGQVFRSGIFDFGRTETSGWIESRDLHGLGTSAGTRRIHR